MRAIVFNSSDSRIDLKVESIALRAALLLADDAVTAGMSVSIIDFNNFYTPKKIYQKATMLEIYYDKKEDAMAEEIRQIIAGYKAMQKIKHKPGQLIARLKKLENSIDALFNDVKKEYYEVHEKNGLPQLNPLMDEDYFNAYWIDSHNPEKEKENQIAASTLLLNRMKDAEKGPVIFLLTPEFFFNEFYTEEIIKSSKDKRWYQPEKIYFERCLVLPNINLLSAPEIKKIRAELQPSAQPFCRLMDEWIRMPRNDEDTFKTKPFLRKKILSAAAALQKNIDSNELLNHYKGLQDNQVVIELIAGEIPVSMLWEFFKHYSVIKEETNAVLLKEKEKVSSFPKRLPVLLVRIPGNSEAPATQKKEMKDVAPVKKSISID
ncbi:MAG TPA: hypothetical protein VI757_01190 [Bacteroidia bacterium]|nr:hypothetical protein [Bacteroidia bacterium]